MTVVYDPLTYRTLVARTGEVTYKFFSVNKFVVDAAAAGLCELQSSDEAPSVTTKLWLDLTLPEEAVGAVKAYSGGAWVALTPQLFYAHIAGGATGYVTDAEMTAYVSGLVGSTLQGYDADLTSIAALSTTAYGRDFLALADAAAGRTALALGTLATQSGTFSGTSSGTNTGDQTITLTGDVTGSGTGSFAATLATVNADTGSWGLAGSVAQFVVNAKGLITSAANVAISIAATAISDATAAGRSMLTAANAAAQTALLSAFVGDSGTGGTKGLVPAPAVGDATKFLRGDGTFASIPGGGDLLAANNLSDLSNVVTARANMRAASFDAGASLGLLTNPFFEISQENGTTAGAAASAYYSADQWYALESSDAVLSVQNVANPFSGTATLKRLQSSVKATATTADGTIAAAQYIQPCVQVIEGTFWNSLGWGTADARAVDIPIIAQCSVTGTYPVAITNAAGNRAYVTTISLTANTPTVCFVTIPGDTGGTWVTTNAASAKLFIGAVGGSDYQASSLNAWEATDNFTHSSCTNWAASGTTNFFQVAYAQIFPSGVLPFTSAAQITGEALQLLLNMRRPYDEELRRCNRYYQKFSGVGANPAFCQVAAYSSTAAVGCIPLGKMRAAPSSISIAGAFLYATTGISATGITLDTAGSTPDTLAFSAAGSGLTTYGCYDLVGASSAASIAANARM